MAGLSVLLESDDSVKAQVISKATLLHSPKISLSPASTRTGAAAAATSSFLQRCSLCRKELAEDNDIYMYRGDRAFCSVECRCRQIFMDEDAGSSYCGAANGAAATRTSRRATRGSGGAGAGGGGGGGGGGVSFAY